MNNFLKLKKLFEKDLFVGDCTANYLIINCANLTKDTPKKCWLKRDRCTGCGDNDTKYTLTFIDPVDTDALVGMWVGSEGEGCMVDATSVDNILASCRTCCDTDQVAITTTYTDGAGVPTIPAVAGGTSVNYCITRADDGSLGAQKKAELDYYGRVKTILLFSASGTSSKYNVFSVVKPAVISPDTIVTAACS